jgi:hypothetical protein
VTIDKIIYTPALFTAINCATGILPTGVKLMSTDKQPLEVDDELSAEESDEAAETPIEVAKTNLAKRKIIDNYLEERRLQKQLNDYDFDL